MTRIPASAATIGEAIRAHKLYNRSTNVYFLLESGKMSIEALLTTKTYKAYLRKKPNPLAQRYSALSDDEFVAIHAYTTEAPENSYADINSQFREKSIDATKWELIKQINGAIKEIAKDNSKSIYFRYTSLNKSEVEKIYKTGFISLHTFFTSVSGINKNFIGPKCNVLLKIQPDTAINPAYIAEISNFPEEEEYLYGPNTYFEVLQVTEITTDEFEISLMERIL